MPISATKLQADGFGDPMLEFDINVLGPRVQKTIPDALRYKPGFSIEAVVMRMPGIDVHNEMA